MRKHVSLIAIAAAMALTAPAYGQAPPVDPAPGAKLIVTATHPAKEKLTVTSPGWKNEEDIPFKYTQYQGNNFPGLEWSKGPAATKSYAIIMQDSGFVARGSPILHWSIVNIPATTTKLPAGMKPEEKPEGSIYGPNYQGPGKPYLGPRTPAGPSRSSAATCARGRACPRRRRRSAPPLPSPRRRG